MDWTAPVDNYCERLSPDLWAEPINALSNLAFIIAAFVVWPRIRGDRGAEALTVILFAIGIGSGLFHTLANRWSGLADVLPILFFILTYLYFATRRALGLPKWAAWASIPLFFPYAAGLSWMISRIAGPMNGSVGYVTVAILIAIYALLARSRDPVTAHGLAIGALILAISIFFRSVDAALCQSIPIGTHFLWHILNAVLLGWMIVTINRPHLAKPAVGR